MVKNGIATKPTILSKPCIGPLEAYATAILGGRSTLASLPPGPDTCNVQASQTKRIRVCSYFTTKALALHCCSTAPVPQKPSFSMQSFQISSEKRHDMAFKGNVTLNKAHFVSMAENPTTSKIGTASFFLRCRRSLVYQCSLSLAIDLLRLVDNHKLAIQSIACVSIRCKPPSFGLLAQW